MLVVQLLENGVLNGTCNYISFDCLDNFDGIMLSISSNESYSAESAITKMLEQSIGPNTIPRSPEVMRMLLVADIFFDY